VEAVWLTGAGKVKMASSINVEEQQQLRKHSSMSGKLRQGTGKVPSVEGAASKRQSSSEQPTTRPSRDPSVDLSDRRGKHHQQPVTSQVGSALSNIGAFLLLSQVN